jgi:hypothetical protein
MSGVQGTGEHLTREEYVGIIAALYDARRVQQDILDLAHSELVIPSDHLEFLARRARDLVQACIRLEEQR